MPAKTIDWNLHIGAIAILRDGTVGLLLSVEDELPIVDGDAAHPNDILLVANADAENEIRAKAMELGFADAPAQNAIIEAVRLLRGKFEQPETRRFETPKSPASAPAVAHTNPQAIIDSLRAEVRLLERELKGYQESPDLSEELERLSKRLEQESQMREKAQKAAIEAEKLMATALEDAAKKDLELRTLRNNAPSVPRVNGLPKEEAKIILETNSSDFEHLWADNWECLHSQFEGGKLRTLWHKVNDYTAPDGNSLHSVVEVALPALETPMEETAGKLKLETADAILYGSVNKIAAPLDIEATETEEEEATDVIISAPVEILPADKFERFNVGDLLLGLPIASALMEHGLDATKEALDKVAEHAAAEAVNAGNPLANLEIKQFSKDALSIPAGV